MTIAKKSLAGAAPAALLLLLGAAGPASAQSNVEEGRPREAVKMCVERAQEIIRDRDRGRDVEVDEIDEADEEDDRVTVEGTVRVEGRDRSRTADLRCEVDFGGDNQIAEFDEDRLLSSLEDNDGNRGRDRRAGGGREVEQAREACRQIARENGWSDIRAEVRDQRDDNDRLVLDMRGQRDNFNPERRCRYNPETNQARFDDPS